MKSSCTSISCRFLWANFSTMISAANSQCEFNIQYHQTLRQKTYHIFLLGGGIIFPNIWCGCINIANFYTPEIQHRYPNSWALEHASFFFYMASILGIDSLTFRGTCTEVKLYKHFCDTYPIALLEAKGAGLVGRGNGSLEIHLLGPCYTWLSQAG